MRYLLSLFAISVISVFAACGTAPAARNASPASPTQAPATQPQKASIDPVVEFLLSSAATDFHEHGPAGPLQFRNLRVGHLTSPDGKDSYRLCGQFLQGGDKAEWMPFATIKTSGYEQYIGGQADSYCQGSSFKWDTEGDLSSSLQSHLDSLQKGKTKQTGNNVNK